MISLDPETVVDLPVDQLGLMVLRDFFETEGWNERNYVLEAQQRAGYAGDAAQAITEAFAWLRARGLTAHDPTDNAQDSVFVTRTGRRVIEDGPDSFYATERLQRGLYPTIEQKARPQFLIGEYEQGVFAAMKAVEVRVRRLAGFGNEVIGVDLMNRAFGRGGPLVDASADQGERKGRGRSSPVHTLFSAIRRVTARLTTTTSLRLRKPSRLQACSCGSSTASRNVSRPKLVSRSPSRVKGRRGTHTHSCSSRACTRRALGDDAMA